MTEPAGCLSLAESYLKTMLANVPAFQTWAGAADVAAALLKIHLEGLPKPADGADSHTRAELEAYRPYAVIWMAEDNGLTLEHDATGALFGFTDSGRLMLRLEQDCPDGVGDQPSSDANLQFKNSIGLIVDGLCALAGTAGYLAFERISVFDGPYWAHPDAVPGHGIFQGVELLFEWGGSQ